MPEHWSRNARTAVIKCPNEGGQIPKRFSSSETSLSEGNWVFRGVCFAKSNKSGFVVIDGTLAARVVLLPTFVKGVDVMPSRDLFGLFKSSCTNV